MAKKCFISVNGGLGKNVMLTALLPLLKEKGYEEIYVSSPYTDVFKSCSAVTDVFGVGTTPTLYEDIILDPECDVLVQEPYDHPAFIKKQVHLLDAWGNLLGLGDINPAVPAVPSTEIPVLDRIVEEFPVCKQVADNFKKEYPKYIIVQFCGGQSPLSPTRTKNEKGEDVYTPYNDHQEGLKRNYYKGQQLIDLLKKEYPDCEILHYALENEPAYEGAIKVQMPYLSYALLARDAEKIVCTDSSLQHLATSAGAKDVTVIWGETRPEHFGYACNKNVCAKHVKNSQPYFRPLGASPAIVRFPEPEEVLSVVKQTTEEYNGNNVTESV